MKKGFLALALAMIIAAMAAPAGASQFFGSPSPSLSPLFGTLVNFDDKVPFTAIGAADYVGLGVASVTETTGAGASFGCYSSSQSGPCYVGTGGGYEIGGSSSMGWDGNILFMFTGLASKVGIGVADSIGDAEVITAYDSAMTVLESYTVPSGSNTYTGIDTGLPNIKYFSIKGDFFAIDDLQHDAKSSVPEPATLLLIGAGLAGVGIVRKRK